MEETLKWIEEHPAISAVIGVGGAIVLLYLFGVFGSSNSNAQSGQSSLAAAYYAAEQAQTVAGTQLNIATVQADQQTAQAQIQANAATSIASTQADMYTTLGNQQLQGNQTLYNDEMLTANTSANDAVQTAANANYYAYLTNQTNQSASMFNTAATTLIPQELAFQVQAGEQPTGTFALPGVGTFNIANAPGSPAALAAAGFSPQEIQSFWG